MRPLIAILQRIALLTAGGALAISGAVSGMPWVEGLAMGVQQ